MIALGLKPLYRVWLPLVCLMFSASFARAHDLWLLPSKFTVAPGAQLTVALCTGDTFPVSESALNPERIERASLVTRRGSTPISSYRAIGTSTVVDLTVPRFAGALIFEVVVRPRTAKDGRESFDRLIRHEGLDHVAALLAREPARREEERRVYTKYAKTLLRVGDPKRQPPLYTKPLRHRLEIVPEVDPFSIRAGEEMPVRLLFDGKPLASARLVAGSTDSATATQSEMPGVRSDANGRARLRFDRPGGPHYVHASHMIPSGRQDVEWETFWATLTFEPAP